MLYRILLFGHVLFVIFWFGGGVMFQIRAEMASASFNEDAVRSIVSDGDRLGKAFFPAVSVLVLLTGVALVLVGKLGFNRIFVIGGLVGWVISSLIGAKGIGPNVARIKRGLAVPDGEAEAVEGLKRLRNVGRVDVAIMTAVVFLMTVKPGR
ncbi:MAG TPA: hypothetical protein VNE62_00890 [Actinomycetota bacterium]|nr:hypothetical protein [Actinomycetota bacterium]